MYRYKYKNRRIWGRTFAEKMAETCQEQIRRWRINEIIPVPLHRSRLRKRGFNQSEILASELAELCGLPVRTDVLYRIRMTEPQKKLGKEQRMRNLRGAFGVSREWIPCENVLLIDDIYTTGSTVERAAKVLKIAGAENVFFLTVSIGQVI